MLCGTNRYFAHFARACNPTEIYSVIHWLIASFSKRKWLELVPNIHLHRAQNVQHLDISKWNRWLIWIDRSPDRFIKNYVFFFVKKCLYVIRRLSNEFDMYSKCRMWRGRLSWGNIEFNRLNSKVELPKRKRIEPNQWCIHISICCIVSQLMTLECWINCIQLYSY